MGLERAYRRLVIWILERLYNGLAWLYDPLAWLLTTGLWYRWVYVAEGFIGEGPVLEVGCGRGRLLSRLAGRGLEVIGLDKSAAMLNATRRRLAKLGLSAKVIRADARSIPLPDASVGTIVNTFPAGYVLDSRTWAEYARLLKPDGRWVVILGCEGFSLRALPIGIAEFLEHLGRRKEIGRLVERLFPPELAQYVRVGRMRVPVFVFDAQRIRATLASMADEGSPQKETPPSGKIPA